MKRTSLYIGIAIVVFLMLCYALISLLGTSGQTMFGSAGSPTAYDRAIAAPGSMTPQQPQQAPDENVVRRMIIRNAELFMQVNNVPQAIHAISTFAETSNGYVVRSNINEDPYNRGNTSAEISIRVPAEGLNSALQQLKSMAYKVIQESISGEDITQQYVDLESQLGNLQQSKKQLEKIMAGATNTEDVLKVQQRLSETQGQIDVLQGQIKYYKESVAFSLITIHLTMNPTIEEKSQSQWKITEAFKSSFINLMNGLRDFTYSVIQIVVYFLPLALLWVAFAFIMFWIGRFIYNLFRR